MEENVIVVERTSILFLTIHHINKDGNKHRRELKKMNLNIYEWLKKKNIQMVLPFCVVIVIGLKVMGGVHIKTNQFKKVKYHLTC